ncbi:undecaprenyl-diphosphate phosphatase [Candidatus Nomurabacteria bacterium]|nr:undecaprenyl-diphosphate phosphatase [Candidatus Nomurabacteria bacterium]
MTIFQSIILGLVQGIAEWLPISSSGHLVLFEHWLGLVVNVEFDIFLHLASLIVVLVFFRKEWLEILKLLFRPKKFSLNQRKNWPWYLILSTVITGFLGWIFYQQIDLFRNPISVAGWLVVTSLLLLATAFSKERAKMSWAIAIVLGLIQGLAVLPGVSRSGALIALALVLGIKKKDAFDYAFLLAIPAIAGSFFLALDNFVWQWVYLYGFILTIIAGYFSLILLKKIINHNYFHWFFIYTGLLALFVFIFSK